MDLPTHKMKVLSSRKFTFICLVLRGFTDHPWDRVGADNSVASVYALSRVGICFPGSAQHRGNAAYRLLSVGEGRAGACWLALPCSISLSGSQLDVLGDFPLQVGPGF